ncbi:MAG: hypothetical protein NTU58_02665 [Candidatus Nealsonbacteria bacterium]|nr:hypothetical protein [Candidatus Nealsonbacteria bacterium]
MTKKNEPLQLNPLQNEALQVEPPSIEPPSNFEALQIIEALQISKSTLERRVREALKTEGLNWNDSPSKFIEAGSILRKKAASEEEGRKDFEWIYTQGFKGFVKNKRSYFQKLKDNVRDRIEALQKRSEPPSNFEPLQLNPLQNEALQFEPPSNFEALQKATLKKIEPGTTKVGQKKRWIRLLRNALKFQNVKHEGKEAVFKKEIEIKDGIIREQKKELKEREIKINQIMVSVGQEQGKVGLLMEENTKLKDQLRLKAPSREE